MGHGAFERQCDLVEMATGDAHAPNEFIDVTDVLLVGLGCKDDRGTPRPEAFSNPAISLEHINLGHDYFASCGPQ